MIGLVLVSHGQLAQAFLAEAQTVVGPLTQVEVVGIAPDDDMTTRREDILSAIARVDTGAGVILLTDMFGGTPSNLAISTMEHANVEVIAGLNMPMLMKLACVRGSSSLREAVMCAKAAGEKYIVVASSMLERRASA